MRMASFLVVPFLGLGLCLASSFTAACGSSGLSCENPSTAEQACLTCENSTCSTDVSATTSACSSYVSCLAACTCGTQSCMDDCLSQAADAGTACENAIESLGTCSNSMCKTPCGSHGS
jgi:hypothetical protein